MELIKQQRIKFINRLSLKRKWTFGDNNPFFDEVWTLMDRVQATTLREYKRKLKLERKKHEKMAMLNYIATSLRV